MAVYYKEKKFYKPDPEKPRLGIWNRLEPRPRAKDFSRALQAQIADPMFMLAKQWQLGELDGEDTGTAVFADLTIKNSPLSRYSSNGLDVEVIEDDIPLEVVVESEEVPIDLKTSILITNTLKKILKSKSLPENIFSEYMSQFPFISTTNTTLSDFDITHEKIEHNEIKSDNKSINLLNTFSQKIINGRAFVNYSSLIVSSNDPLSNLNQVVSNPQIFTNNKESINDALIAFNQWYSKLFFRPTTNQKSWDSERLEYSFEIAANNQNGTKTVLSAKEYYRGNPDWEIFNIDNDSTNSNLSDPTSLIDEKPPLSTVKNKLIVTQSEFPGMPNKRYWALENGVINFGRLNVNKTDLATLVVAEFGLYSNEGWMVIPHQVPVGSISHVDRLVVTDNFGFKTLVNPVQDGASKWSMYNLSNASNEDDKKIIIPPTTFKTQEGDPIEKVLFIRDELSNMVWGIENIIPDIYDGGIDASQSYRKLVNYLKTNYPKVDDSIEVEASYKYQYMSATPENWIPFIPVNISNDTELQDIMFQRGRMIRNIPGVRNLRDDDYVKPRGKFLREVPAPYRIHDEEIPREGIQVIRSFQRTRWMNGETYCWLGRKKKIGKGEGSSGLRFDVLEDGNAGKD